MEFPWLCIFVLVYYLIHIFKDTYSRKRSEWMIDVMFHLIGLGFKSNVTLLRGNCKSLSCKSFRFMMIVYADACCEELSS
jgi:hypothetical protein